MSIVMLLSVLSCLFCFTVQYTAVVQGTLQVPVYTAVDVVPWLVGYIDESRPESWTYWDAILQMVILSRGLS